MQADKKCKVSREPSQAFPRIINSIAYPYFRRINVIAINASVVVKEERAVIHSRVSGLASAGADQESPYLSNGG